MWQRVRGHGGLSRQRGLGGNLDKSPFPSEPLFFSNWQKGSQDNTRMPTLRAVPGMKQALKRVLCKLCEVRESFLASEPHSWHAVWHLGAQSVLLVGSLSE